MGMLQVVYIDKAGPASVMSARLDVMLIYCSRFQLEQVKKEDYM